MELTRRREYLAPHHRRPSVDVHDELEACRHDAHHRLRGAINRHSRADDAPIAAEVPLPELVAEDHDPLAAGFAFLVDELSPYQRHHAERAEEAR